MSLSHYDTETLMGVILALDAPVKPIANLYLPAVIEFDDEYVTFDKVLSSRKIAPYVSPVVQGKVMKTKSERVEKFKPAYVKPKHVVDPAMALRRRAGERIGGVLTPAQRMDLIIAQTLQEQDDTITRREEFMALEALRTGKVIVESENFPRMEVDFARASGQTVALTGGARWGESGVSPLASLRAWAALVQEASGVFPYHVVMDPLAAGHFTKDPEIRAVLDIRRQAGGIAELFGVNVGAQGREYRRLAELGEFTIDVYQQFYVNEAGSPAKMMPDNTVIMGNPEQASGTQCYGAIQDKGAMRALSRFPKMWDENDPSVTYLMTQSAPLPVFGRIESTFCATVR